MNGVTVPGGSGQCERRARRVHTGMWGAWLLALLALVGLVGAPVAMAAPLSAKSLVLVEVRSGQVLDAQSADTPVEPASLAKMMTLYLIYRAVAQGQVGWDDPVRISERAWRTGGSKMFVREGDRISLRRLMEGIGIVSGNDACIAVAEFLSGSEAGFVAWMNEVAAEMGLTDTRFATATGFPAPDQLTTARDMAELARRLIADFPDVLPVLATLEFTHENITQQNRNGLLREDIGVDGVKTGHTESAGYHLVASARRGDQQLLVAVLGSDSAASREAISRRYLMTGFRTYATVTPLPPTTPVADVRVWKGAQKHVVAIPEAPVWVTVRRGQEDAIAVAVEVVDAVAPITAGQVLGTARLSLEGEVIATVPLVAATDVPPAGLLVRLWHSLVMFLYGVLDTLF